MAYVRESVRMMLNRVTHGKYVRVGMSVQGVNHRKVSLASSLNNKHVTTARSTYVEVTTCYMCTQVCTPFQILLKS